MEEAQQYMEKQGVSEFEEVIKETALDTTPETDSVACYAVAHGATPGIKVVW
jgi:hypothetical protein